MVENTLGLIFILSVIAGMVLFMRNRIRKYPVNLEPDALRIALHKKEIANMQPVEVKHILVIGKGEV
jgi:hypothetical protein